jgi:hypothetical protein
MDRLSIDNSSYHNKFFDYSNKFKELSPNSRKFDRLIMDEDFIRRNNVYEELINIYVKFIKGIGE